MMSQPPSVKAKTESRMQHIEAALALDQTKNMPHPPGLGGQGGAGGSYAAGPLYPTRHQQSFLPNRNVQSDQKILTMKGYQMQNKMMPRADGSISKGSATSSSLDRKFSLRRGTAMIGFLSEGKEGSDHNARERAKSKAKQPAPSPPITCNLTLRNSWSRSSVVGI